MADPLVSNVGSFVPTTNIWDVQQIYSTDVNSAEFKELLVRLYQNINNISMALNIKDVGYYPIEEFLNGQLFFPSPNLDPNTTEGTPFRQVFRTVVDFGTLSNNGVTSIPHNINIDTITPSEYSFTRIYGAASKPDQTSFIPIPYSSTILAENISLSVTNTDIVITTAQDYSDYTICYIIVEYIKS